MPPQWLGTSAYAVNAQVTYAEAGPINPFWYVLKCISPVSAVPPNTSNPPPITSFGPPVVVNTANWVLQNPGEPAYVNGQAYLPGDVVSFGGAAEGANPPLYMCLVETTASPGATPSSWKALATAGDAPGAVTVSSIAASGISVTQPTAGNYLVAASLGAAAGSGITVAAGTGTAQNLSVNLTTANGCGISKTPSGGDTSLGLALNLSVGAGLTLTPSTVSGDTNTVLTVDLGTNTGLSGQFTTSGALSISGSAFTIPNTTAVYPNAIIMVTPNSSLVDTGAGDSPYTGLLTWNLNWNAIPGQLGGGLWVLSIDQSTSTKLVSFTYVILSRGAPAPP
jgi:hypothetical protein